MLSSFGVLMAFVIFYFRNWIGSTLQLLDHPDSERRLHGAATPKIGSIAFIGTLGMVLLDRIGSGPAIDFHVFYLFAIVAFHFAIGLCDDMLRLRALARFSLSVLVCGCMFYADGDLVIHQLAFSNGLILRFGPTSSFLLSVLGLVFFIYATNLSDGKNGIIGICGLIWVILLWVSGVELPPAAIVAICATLLLFLAYNLSGKVFAGDAGAYVVGAGVGLGAMSLYKGGIQPTLYLDQLLVWFILPMFDAARVLLVRAMRGNSPFRGGMDHFHHLLWRRFGPGYGLLIYCSFVATPSIMSLLFPARSFLILGLTLAAFAATVIWLTDYRRLGGVFQFARTDRNTPNDSTGETLPAGK